MGATNHTTNYNLSQFIGTDKPSWLNDYNGDMSAIDTAIKNAADAAALAQSTATNADSIATSASNTASALSTQINTPVTGIAAQVSAHDTAITGIENTIGSTPLTTTAQTLTGAIEEVKGSIPSVSGALKLVQTQTISKTYDGTLSVGDALNAIYTDLVSAFSALTSGQYIKISGASYNTGLYALVQYGTSELADSVKASYKFNFVMTDASVVTTGFFDITSSSVARYASSPSFSVTVDTATKPASGNARLVYEVYEVLS